MDPPQSYHINNPFCNVKGIGRRTGKPIYKKRVVEDGMHSFDAYLSESDASTTFCPTPVPPSSSPQSSTNESDVDISPQISHQVSKPSPSGNHLPTDGNCATVTDVQTILAHSETHIRHAAVETGANNNESFPDSKSENKIDNVRNTSQMSKSQCTEKSSFRLVNENIPNKPSVNSSEAKTQKVSPDGNKSQKTQDVTLMTNVKQSDSTTEDICKRKGSIHTERNFKKTAPKRVSQQPKDKMPSSAVVPERLSQQSVDQMPSTVPETDAHFLIRNSGLDSEDSSADDDRVKNNLVLNKVPVNKNSTQDPDEDSGVKSETQKPYSEKFSKQTSNSSASLKSDSDDGMVEGQLKSLAGSGLGNPVSQANDKSQVKKGAESCVDSSEHKTLTEKILPLGKISTAAIADHVPDKASLAVNQKSEAKSITPDKPEVSKTLLDFGGDVTGSVSNTEKISSSQFFGIKKRLTFSKALPDDLMCMERETHRKSSKSVSAFLNNYDTLPASVSSDTTIASEVNPTGSSLDMSSASSDDFCIVDNESVVVTVTSKGTKNGKRRRKDGVSLTQTKTANQKDGLNSTQTKTANQKDGCNSTQTKTANQKDDVNSTQAKTDNKKLRTVSSLTVKHQQSTHQPQTSTVKHQQSTHQPQTHQPQTSTVKHQQSPHQPQTSTVKHQQSPHQPQTSTVKHQQSPHQPQTSTVKHQQSPHQPQTSTVKHQQSPHQPQTSTVKHQQSPHQPQTSTVKHQQSPHQPQTSTVKHQQSPHQPQTSTVKHQQSPHQPQTSTVKHQQSPCRPAHKKQKKQRNVNKKNRKTTATRPDGLHIGDESQRPNPVLTGEDSVNVAAQRQQDGDENLLLQIADKQNEFGKRKHLVKSIVPPEGVRVNQSRSCFVDYSIPLNESPLPDNQKAPLTKQGGKKSNVKISTVKKAARTRRSKTIRSRRSNKGVLNISTHSSNEKNSTKGGDEDHSDTDVTPVKLKLLSTLPGVTPVSGVSIRVSRRITTPFEEQDNLNPEEDMGSPICMQRTTTSSTPTTTTPSCLRDISSKQPKRKIRKVRISQYVEQKEVSPCAEEEDPGMNCAESTQLSVTSSPVHYAETTTNVEFTKSKSPKLTLPDLSYKIVRPPETEDVGLRRSKRTRVKRLNSCKGEGIIYRRDSSGFGLVVDGIQPSVVEAKFKAQQEERRRKLRQRRLRAMTVPAQAKKRLSSHFQLEQDVTSSSQLPVINPDNDEEVVVEVIARPDTWCNSDLQPVSKADPLAVCLKLQQPGFCTGDLHMRPLAEKASELAVQTLIFSVIHGKICFTLNGVSTIVDTGVDFFIPRGSTYALKNLRRDIAKLHFIDMNDCSQDVSTGSD